MVVGRSGTPSKAGTTLLLFGPQVLSFNKQSFDKLRSTLLDSPLHRWILDAVEELPTYWKVISKQIPRLRPVDGEKLLTDLDGWFKTGTYSESHFNLPNTVLTPLVVLTQLTQYSRILELTRTQQGTPDDIQQFFAQHNSSTLGFCTGILSAFAVSSSSNQRELEKYGAVAVRLAVLIGALVDAQESSDKVYGRAKSYATAWSSPEHGVDMARIIDQFPEAYVSVLYDEKRATVTTSQRTAPMLLQQLKAAGIVVSEVGLRGRFHCRHYYDDLDAVIQLCDSDPAFQFPDASQLTLPSYTNVDAEPIRTGKLHHLALRAILLEQSNWYQTFAVVQSSLLNDQDSLVVSFGPDRCVPPSLMRKLGARLLHAADLDQDSPQLSASVLDPEVQHGYARDAADNDIAVIGMSIKVAGADDLEEFWHLNCEAKSQHIEVPESRFGFQTMWRELDTKRKWYGNFLRDVDAFDHKFFKRSPREAASMDPQQRLMLQAAYQAVEQSGYFALPNPDKQIGCYVGACAADYEHNVACHPANAFTATGNLKSFVPGKVAHYFGWTGPAMTMDTACSASAVAIHTACRAILTGECTGGALAGGVATMSNPIWFQNLAGATFLSPTGQCKPFDDLADGYCRGEGIACVFLKKMSTAIEDGNQIFACIPSTAVLQNENCTPLFVPNSPSLSHLFREVIRQARLEPEDISVVEAHGTGTPVGDPAEYESIRLALGGPCRATPLLIASVKGLVGHTEGTSGVISLIKVVLMLQEGYIPAQASFSKMSHHITASPSDMIEVPTSLRPWSEQYRAALINNYGASGSNASMIVTQSIHCGQETAAIHSGEKHPFWITAFDERSLSEYCMKLSQFLKSKVASRKKIVTVADLSFNVSRQSNRSFSHGSIFSCGSIEELEEKLTCAATSGQKNPQISIKPSRSVILCFGGQISTFIGLDRKVYETVKIFRSYLDHCNSTIQSLGLEGIFPEIFHRTPIKDTVKLQTMLFAMQYSCAKCWIDCGVEVAAVVGHSFGEITALCISGVLSLKDTVKLVAGRAKVVQDLWGNDPGSMMAVEGDISMVQQLVAESNKAYGGNRPCSIACYNGPRSFTLAGSTGSMEVVAEKASKDAGFSSLKTKMLNVTNAFHSTLVEPLVMSLEQLGNDVIFKKPVIPLERATESFQSANNLTPSFVAEHMRNPVFFDHAIQRLAKQHPSCVWLEAGSSSTITVMANRALGSSADSHFQAVNITCDGAMKNLTDTTVSLWKEGQRISFWAHHALQTYEYTPLFLPPYQFEKHRHWVDLKVPQSTLEQADIPSSKAQEEIPTGLWTFVGYNDTAQQSARFRINTMTMKYEQFVRGHLIARTAPICPATLEVDIAIEAILSLLPNSAASEFQPQVLDMQNHVPICVDSSRFVWLDCEATDPDYHTWNWKIVSNNGPDARNGDTVHVNGKMRLRSPEDQEYKTEFARYERMVSYKRCLNILESDEEADDIILGRNIYKMFAEIVDYGEIYRGVKKVVGKGDECAGRIQKKYTGETWLDTLLSDCFSQVGGIWVNYMTDREPTDMYIASGCEIVMRSPKVSSGYKRPESWDVFASHHRISEKVYLTDVFIFDPTDGSLMEVMLGIQYMKVAKASMSKILTRFTASDTIQAPPSTGVTIQPPAPMGATIPASKTSNTVSTTDEPKEKEKNKKSSRPDISGRVKDIIANISGLDAAEIKNDSELADFGIDSLIGMEMAREVEEVFKCTLDPEELMEATSFRKFLKCILAALYPEDANADTATDYENRDISDDASWSDQLSNDETPRTSPTDSPPAEAETPTKSCPEILQSDILEAFGESKMLTDKFIREYKIDNFADVILSKSTQLCVALTLEAFEQLGCSLRTAASGEKLAHISYEPQHERLVQYLYNLLENEARLIDTKDSQIVRTAISVPKKSSEVLLQELLNNYPEWIYANKLTFFAGKALADVLRGNTDGIRVIFGTAEGRELVSALYCEHSFNKMSYEQMKDFISRLISRLPMDDGPLKILEMGAGTGGTTLVLAPYLASLNVPVEYTFTDLAPSMVAQARRKFKAYPFMKFAVHDIEKPPAEDLRNQHIVIASNAVHATHSLTKSGENIRAALRPDGFLMMLEMTAIVPFIDIIFGLLEGWWLFDDGRQHAIAPMARWEKDLQSVGYGHVDWTDGNLPENDIQKVIIALASGQVQERLPKPAKQPLKEEFNDVEAREAAVARYVEKFSQGFGVPIPSDKVNKPQRPDRQCVFLTGATGSLGSHLVAQFAELSDVWKVVCVNRRSSIDVETRQRKALSSRGIVLDEEMGSKLKVIETDTSKPKLGVSDTEYEWLVQHVTHIVHNAWPMSGSRPIQAFETQFQVLRNLIDFAYDIASQNSAGFKVSFQLISSIGVVGHYPLWSGKTRVPEERMEMNSVLTNGYCEAKFTCERILDATLHKYPEHFRPMTVRLGQIAGSRTSGYWNPVEHFSFLVKSSQSLKILPDLGGILSWVPVNEVAGTLVDLLIADTTPYPLYHIDNPAGQPWSEMIEVLADTLDIPHKNIIPFEHWVQRVRRSPLPINTDNPAGQLIGFLDDHFLRMSCGGLLLDTSHSKEHSKTLATQGPVSADVARKYVRAWKEMGFLHR